MRIDPTTPGFPAPEFKISGEELKEAGVAPPPAVALPSSPDSFSPAEAGNASEIALNSLKGTFAPMGGPLDGIFETIQEELVTLQNAQTARAKAESLFYLPAPEASVKDESPFRTVLREGLAANAETAYAGTKVLQDLNDKATLQLGENRAAEAAAIAKLSPSQAAQYQAIVEQTAQDPMARLALQILLEEGKLTGSLPSKDGADLLTTLGGMCSQELAPGLDRRALLGEMIKEIGFPSIISQRNKNTCTMTSMEILLATQRPAEYARLVAGLASPEGKAVLMNGGTIARPAGTEHDDGSTRTPSSRLFQSAMLDYGNGVLGYDNAADHSLLGPIATGGGMIDGSTAGMYSAITGKDVRTVFAKDDNLLSDITSWLFGAGEAVITGNFVGSEHRASLIDQIAQSTASGKPVLTSVAFDVIENGKTETGGHEIMVTKVTDDTVYYNNPWGNEEKMSREEFTKRLNSASFVDFT